MKKLILIGLIFLGFFGVVLKRTERPVALPSPSPVVQAVAVLTVDFGDGKVATSSAGITEGLTAYELLIDRSELEIKTKQYDFGVFVENINGYESTKDKVWIYFVNGKSGDIAADKYVLKPGDKVEWKYIKPQE